MKNNLLIDMATIQLIVRWFEVQIMCYGVDSIWSGRVHNANIKKQKYIRCV